MSHKISVDVLRTYFSRMLEKATREGDCLIWPENNLNSSGYGQLEVRLVKYGGRKRFLAHRVSYLLANGSLPSDKQVKHECDVKRCVEPSHLTLGEQADNEADKVRRGRSSRGQKRWSAQLTDKQAQKVLDDCRRGVSVKTLSEQYGVSHGIVRSIKNRTRWKHLI